MTRSENAVFKVLNAKELAQVSGGFVECSGRGESRGDTCNGDYE